MVTPIKFSTFAESTSLVSTPSGTDVLTEIFQKNFSKAELLTFTIQSTRIAQIALKIQQEQTFKEILASNPSWSIKGWEQVSLENKIWLLQLYELQALGVQIPQLDGNQPSPTSLNLLKTETKQAITEALSKVTHLDLSKKVQKCPQAIYLLTNLTHLTIADSNLTEPPNVSQNLKLEYLDLRKNLLTTPPVLISNANLKSLDLSNNRFTTPPDLSQNTRLIHLSLNHNSLTAAPDFSHNAHLEYLALASNKLKTPPNVSHNAQLVWLDLAHNKLTRGPDLSKNLKMENLFLDHNPLNIAQIKKEGQNFSIRIFPILPTPSLLTVPPPIIQKIAGYLPTVGNLMATIPGTYTEHDQKIRDLLYKMPLEEFFTENPDWRITVNSWKNVSIQDSIWLLQLYQLRNLPLWVPIDIPEMSDIHPDNDSKWSPSARTPELLLSKEQITKDLAATPGLNLSNKKLKKCPNAIRLFTTLFMLDLSKNELETAPDITRNRNLQDLNLSENKLTDAPDLSHNTSLRVLYLNNNRIKTPPNLRNNAYLQILNLSGNQLSIPPDLSSNPNLEELYLTKNALNTLPDLSKNLKLKLLEIDTNKLTAEGKKQLEQLRRERPSLKICSRTIN